MAWIWFVWLMAGLFLIVSALAEPSFLNVAVVALWAIFSIVQLVVHFRARAVDPKQRD